MLWPASHAVADKPGRALFSAPGHAFWQARFSPDGRWISFVVDSPAFMIDPCSPPGLKNEPAGADSDRMGMESGPNTERRTTERRGRDRGGRRRTDWPEDAGLTACPTCGHEFLQSQGALDTGEYVWTCLGCRREFHTNRASRLVL